MTRSPAPIAAETLRTNVIGGADMPDGGRVGTRVQRTYVGELGGPAGVAAPPDPTPDPSKRTESQ